MKLVDLGKYLTTNDVQINEDYVTKRFKNFSPTMLWAPVERKPVYSSARRRYERDKRVATTLYSKGLNVPEITDYSDDKLWFRFITLDLEDLVSVFENPRISYEEKMQYFREAMQLLKTIHEAGEFHGDTYLKNFFRLNRQYDGRNGRVYTCDFEYDRTSPLSQVTDVMILTADAMVLLKRNHKEESSDILEVISDVYGDLSSYPFDWRDRKFFEFRFGIGSDFFDYFS